MRIIDFAKAVKGDPVQLGNRVTHLPIGVGLFIGAWGVSNALSRLVGTLMAGIVRDLATLLTDRAILGYVIVFSIEALMLAVAAFMLTRIDTSAFQRQVEIPSAVERVALSD